MNQRLVLVRISVILFTQSLHSLSAAHGSFCSWCCNGSPFPLHNWEAIVGDNGV